MSGAMDEAMEAWDRGYDSADDTFVCANHFHDYGVKNFIVEQNQDNRCSYCRSKRAIPLDELVKHIFDSFGKFYTTVEAGSVPLDNEIGSWAGEYPDSTDLIFHELGLGVEPYELQEKISEMCYDDLWVRRNAFTLEEDDYLMDSWEFFSKILKEQIRFVFFKTRVDRHDPISMATGPTDPSMILNDIGKLIDGLSMYKTYRKSKPLQLFRARVHSKKETITDCTEIASPPHEKAAANRFSAAGISMFYGSADRKTALLEVKKNYNPKDCITSARFTIKQTVTFIDLTNLPTISIFDEKKNEHYDTIAFLHRFIEIISEPLLRDHSEHIDYVPTQVVTEYLRHIFPDQFDKDIHGIKYNSAINGKICYVLFFEQQHAANDDEPDNKYRPVCLEKRTLKRNRLISGK
jgi:hypothetical protein